LADSNKFENMQKKIASFSYSRFDYFDLSRKYDLIILPLDFRIILSRQRLLEGLL
jgi:hypothetical protein